MTTNFALASAAFVTVAIGAAHSFLGEKLVLAPLFRHGEPPKLMGSSTFFRHTLRFAWHLTTILLFGIGAVIVALSFSQLQTQSTWVLRIVAVTIAACSLLSLIGARAKHFSWWVFLVIATLLWIGAR